MNEGSLGFRLFLDPHDKKAHEQLCSILEKRGDYRGLVEERKHWLQDNPEDSGELIYLVSDAEVRLDDPELAIDATTGFLDRLKPGDTLFGWANNYLGRQLVGRDNVAEAAPLLERATRADPDDAQYWADYGGCLARAGDSTRGLAALRKAVALDPSSGPIHERLGDALGQTGDYRGEETEYKAALSLFEKSIGKKYHTSDSHLLLKCSAESWGRCLLRLRCLDLTLSRPPDQFYASNISRAGNDTFRPR